MEKRHGFSLTLALIIAALVITAVVVIPEVRPDRPKTTSINLSLVSDTQSVAVGEELTVRVRADTGKKSVAAVELYLSYDPKKIDAVDIKASQSLPVVLQEGSIADGVASIIVGAKPEKIPQGDILVATLTAKTKKAGSATFEFADKTQVAAIGQTDNAAGMMKGIELMIK